MSRAAAFLAGLAAGLGLLFSFGFVGIWIAGAPTNDFSLIWSGPRLLLSGSDPYDPATFAGATQGLGTQPTATAVYIYPGWVAVLLAPLGALGLATANVVWMVIGLAAASIGLAALIGAGARLHPLVRALIGFTLVASEAGIVTFYSGQIDFLIVGGLGLMAAWLYTGRQAPAGIAGAVMLLKPQLFLLAFPALLAWSLARGQRRFALSLIAAAVALAVLSTLVVPQWWSAWLTHVAFARTGDVRAATLPNALRDTLGAAGLFLGYGLLAASVVAVVAFGRSRAALPVWLTVSLAAAPYLFVYDHIVDIVPLTIAAMLNAERSPAAATSVALAGALILTVLATFLHAVPGIEHGTLSFNGLAQFALTALIIGSLWRFRTDPLPSP